MNWKSVDALISRKSLLKHAFYQAWSAGELTIDDLKTYAKQYYHLEKNFGRLLSRIHTNCEDASVRQSILENLVDEESGQENHRELWLRFAEGLGLKREEVENAEAAPKTRAALESLRELAADPDCGVGLAGLYAYESQQPKVAATKIEGLKKFYGIDDKRSLKFFEVHKELDKWHSEEERWMIEASGTEMKDIKVAAGVACAALLMFLDGVDESTRKTRLGESCTVC